MCDPVNSMNRFQNNGHWMASKHWNSFTSLNSNFLGLGISPSILSHYTARFTRITTI